MSDCVEKSKCSPTIVSQGDSGRFRQSNIELCRIFAIILVVLGHTVFGFADGVPNSLSDTNIIFLMAYAFSVVGVNVFVLITGYFSVSPKMSSLANLLYICLFYAVLRIVVGLFVGFHDVRDFFFISRSNWFIPSYLGLLLFAPILNEFIEKRKRSWGGYLLIMILFQVWFGYMPAISTITPGFQKGYSTLSFCIIYMIGRYIRLYDVHPLFRRYSFWVYVLFSLATTVFAYLLIVILDGRGKDIPFFLWTYGYAYSSPMVLIASVAFFLTFEKVSVKQSKLINFLSQSVLAVLLVHTSDAIIPYLKTWFHSLTRECNTMETVFYWVVSIICIFIISVLIDQLRIISYRIVKKPAQSVLVFSLNRLRTFGL